MKNILLLSVVILVFGCADRSTESEQIKEYYEGFRNANYNRVKRLISDTLTITEGDYVMTFTPESFYERFRWDSVFQPVYQLVALESEGEPLMATVSVRSLRFKFLKNNPLTCQHKFHFKSGKISKIENLECVEADWELWQKERDSLVNWIKRNHPELDGFIHDLSKEGAQDYLNAIELYRKRQAEVMR